MKNFVLTFSLIVIIFTILAVGLNLQSRKLVLQARETRKEVSSTSNKIVALVETKDEIEMFQPQLTKINQALPTSTQALETVKTLITKHGLTASVTQSPTGTTAQSVNGELNLTVEGASPNLQATNNFVKDLEQQIAIFTIKRLVITGSKVALTIGVSIDENH